MEFVEGNEILTKYEWNLIRKKYELPRVDRTGIKILIAIDEIVDDFEFTEDKHWEFIVTKLQCVPENIDWLDMSIEP